MMPGQKIVNLPNGMAPNLIPMKRDGVSVVYRLNRREDDHEQICRLMERIAHEASIYPEIRDFALKVAPPYVGKKWVQAKVLGDWVAKNMRYQADPPDCDYLRTPFKLIAEWHEKGYATGDCDDHALLASALFRTLGFPSRILAVSYYGKRIDHVLCEVYITGRWIQFDGCRKSNPWKQVKWEKTHRAKAQS